MTRTRLKLGLALVAVAAIVGGAALLLTREGEPGPTEPAPAMAPRPRPLNARSDQAWSDEAALVVTVRAAGQAIDGAEVRAWERVAGEAHPQRWRLAGTAKTAGGEARIPARGEGTFLLVARSFGFAPSRLEVARSAQETLSRCALDLAPGLEVAGHVVTRGRREPIPLAEVALDPWLDDLVEPDGPADELMVAASGPKGELRYQSLAPGRYLTKVRATGFSEVHSTLTVPHPGPWIIELYAAGFLAGRVVDGAGHPVADAEVTAMSEGSTVSTTSGPGGGFSLEVESGTHWLSARKAELAGRLAAAVAVGPGATRSGLVLALTAGAQIAGRVTARTDDSPILNARIAVRRMDGEPVAGATSDAEGNYAVEGLAAGAYDVVVSASGYSRLWETGIGLMAAGRFTHDVALGRAASIEGTISSADGRPVAGALIAVLESDFPVAQTFRARSDASGRFHLDGLDEGSVEVNAFREATGDCAFRAVELAAGETAEADLVFDLKGVIKGKVAGSDGAPPGRPAVVEASMLGAMDSQPLAKTPVARDGSYRLEVPAQLQAVAAHWADEEWDPKSPAAMVEVKAGETAQCDLVISDGARQLVVDGVVLEPGRVPARGAKVTVVSDSGSAWSATSDADGRFEVREEGTVSKRPLSVRAQKGGRVVEVKGVRAGARNLVLALKPGATLRGNVVSREPVDGFTLRLLSAADVLQEADGTSFEQELRFEGSSFEVDDLPSVQMSVTASDDENRAGQVVVELKAGEVTRADLVLGPLARVAGRLVLASGRSPSQGGVSAVRKDGSHGGDGEVGPEGRFSIDDLAAGSYDLLAVAPREGQSLTRGFSVAAGQVLDLGDVVLEDERPDPGRIGVTLVDQELGVFVDHVIAGSPAARAGIREGDLIVAVDGVLVESAEEVVARAPGTPGTPVSITVGRDGAEQVLQMERAR